MKIFSEDILILRQLLTEKNVDLYKLHQIYKLSPAQIVRSVTKLSNKNIIIDKETTINITEFGIKWIEANRNFIFLKKFKNFSSYNSNLYNINKIELNSLYKPKIKSIDKRIFKEG